MKTLIFFPVLVLALSLTARSIQAAPKAAQGLQAEVRDSQGSVIGEARFESSGKKGTVLRVKVSGLAPGKHGIHIHESGKCEGPDFKSAGGHFKSEGQKHGLEVPGGGHHLGDMPNLVVGDDGKSSAELELKAVKLGDLEGKALVVHEKEDDQKSDPAGNSGARVACGVIGPISSK